MGVEGLQATKHLTLVQEESSKSLFSLSIDSRMQISSAEAENEVDSVVPAHATDHITQREAQGRLAKGV